MRLPIQEVTGMIIESSNARHEVFERLGKPKSKADAIKMLGDQSAKVHPVFRDSAEYVKTVAVGKEIKSHEILVHSNVAWEMCS